MNVVRETRPINIELFPKISSAPYVTKFYLEKISVSIEGHLFEFSIEPIALPRDHDAHITFEYDVPVTYVRLLTIEYRGEKIVEPVQVIP